MGLQVVEVVWSGPNLHFLHAYIEWAQQCENQLKLEEENI